MVFKKHRIIEINSTVDELKFLKADVCRLFNRLDELGKYPVENGSISVTFLNIHDMCNVHKQFLSDPSLTDVITFPGSQEFNFAGEICISPDYALNASKTHNTSLSEELTLYLIHGYLHLAKLNDIEEADILKMRTGEKLCMDFIKSSNTLPVFQIIK